MQVSRLIASCLRIENPFGLGRPSERLTNRESLGTRIKNPASVRSQKKKVKSRDRRGSVPK